MVNDNPALTTAQTLGKSWPTNWTYVNMLDTPGSTLKPWQNTRCNLFKSSLDGCVTWLSRSLLTRDSEQPIRVTEKADVALLAELGILGNVIATLELETKGGCNLAYLRRRVVLRVIFSVCNYRRWNS